MLSLKFLRLALRIIVSKPLLYLILFFFSYEGKAQQKIVMGPTPDVASVAKYVDRPVSYYTGIPEINVPLWTINLKNYTLALGLNYHGGGVKVEEDATMVGLNWSLSAGGVITRSVKDIPDDYNKDGKITRLQDRPLDVSPNAEHLRYGRFWSGKYALLRDFDFSSSDKNYLITTMQNARANANTAHGSLRGGNDLEPDVFYFSFGNKSGKFVFDVNGSTQKVLLIPYQDVVITHTLDVKGEISSFTILDNDGTEYFFDKVERIKRVVGSANRSPDIVNGPETVTNEDNPIETITEYNSSWHLSEIKTIYRETITFDYADEEFLQYDCPTTEYVIGKYNNGLSYNKPRGFSAGSNQSSSKKRVTKISTSKEIINFEGGHARQDLNKTSYAITGVEIINVSTGKRLRRFDLNYSYFQSPASESFKGTYTNFFSIPTSEAAVYYKRLRLDKIWEKGEGDSVKPPYIFDYETSTPLPHRFSYQQDIWGYFNGASGNTNLFPTLYIYPKFSGSDRFRVYMPCYTYLGNDNLTYSGGNRLPDSTFMKMGSLKKMTYPTGGYSTFLFEPNTFSYDSCTYTGGGLRIREIKNYISSNAAVPATSISYSYLDNGHSSGRIISLPIYAHKSISETMYYNFSQVVLGTTSASLVGYKVVTENFQNEGNNGSIKYEYSIPASYNQATDPEYGLYNISQVKWTDNVTSSTWGTVDYQEFLNYKNAYHLLPNTSPFPTNPEYDWNRGKLIKQSFFNSKGTLIKDIVNTYKIYTAPLWKGSRNVFGLVYNFIGYDENSQQYSLLYSKYGYLTNRANVLDATVTKTYHTTTQTTSESDSYTYAEAGHMNPVQRVTKLSDGNLKIQKLLFPYDYSDQTPLPPEILVMRNRNFTNVPIENLFYIKRNNEKQLISGTITKYQSPDYNILMLEKQYRANISNPILNFKESSTYHEDFRMDGSYEELFSYDKYDFLGNLIQSKDKENIIRSYVWGRSKLFPLAETINASYEDMAYAGFEGEMDGGWANIEMMPIDDTSDPFLGGCSYDIALAREPLTKSGLNKSKKYELSLWTTSPMGTVVKIGNQPTSGTAVLTKGGYTKLRFLFTGVTDVKISGIGNIDELRLHPEDALMVTNTLDPMIGLKNVTDGKGMITYYEYDAFQQLKFIKDQDGNIVKSYEYHYKP